MNDPMWVIAGSAVVIAVGVVFIAFQSWRANGFKAREMRALNEYLKWLGVLKPKKG